MDISERIWREHQAGLRAFVKRRVPDGAAADDILQDIFLKMHIHVQSLKDETKAKAWLFSIARNAVIDYYRSRKPAEDLPEWLPQPEPDPAGEVMRKLSDCVPTLVQLLPEHYREAVILSELKGLPQREVARVQGISLSGAKSRVQRGRALLKTMLDDYCGVEYDHGGRPRDFEPKSKACAGLLTIFSASKHLHSRREIADHLKIHYSSVRVLKGER